MSERLDYLVLAVSPQLTPEHVKALSSFKNLGHDLPTSAGRSWDSQSTLFSDVIGGKNSFIHSVVTWSNEDQQTVLAFPHASCVEPRRQAESDEPIQLEGDELAALSDRLRSHIQTCMIKQFRRTVTVEPIDIDNC